MRSELIETLWNVNNYLTYYRLTTTRINRNIVECKYIPLLKDDIRFSELIETLWNVNTLKNGETFYGSEN